MQNIIFRPKYPIHPLLGLVFLISLETLFLWQFFSSKENNFELLLGIGLFGLTILMFPFVYIRQIKFDSRSFGVEKYSFQSKLIDYSDVMDIGKTMITTKKGNIPTMGMTNSVILIELFKQLISEGKISSLQIENKLIASEVLSRKAILPASVIAFILWVITSFVFRFEKSLFRDLSLLLYWIPTYFLVYNFMKINTSDP